MSLLTKDKITELSKAYHEYLRKLNHYGLEIHSG